ncbi:MAG: Mut7-C RNAse domain-containing protein [bacterium]
MKFLVDFMLGRLCKWLRLLGYDASYFVSEKKSDLIYQSLKEGRIILTRDHRLSKKKAIKLVIINSDLLEEQLEQVFSELDIKVDPDEIFTRCLVCNEVLQEIKKEKVKDRVPNYVFQTKKDFSFCPNCQKIYWKGTHWDLAHQLLKKLKRAKE